MNKQNQRQSNEPWSGEATRNQGFAVEETRVDVTLDGSDVPDTIKPKDRPVWMTESTVISTDANAIETTDSILQKAALSSTQSSASMSNSSSARNRKENEDIMSVLLQHEKQQGKNNTNQAAVRGLAGGNSSDSSDDERDIENAEIRKLFFKYKFEEKILNYSCFFFCNLADVDIMESESEDDAPTVMVAGRPHPIDEINDELISQMTQQEKDTYIQVYQDHFSHMYD